MERKEELNLMLKSATEEVDEKFDIVKSFRDEADEKLTDELHEMLGMDNISKDEVYIELRGTTCTVLVKIGDTSSMAIRIYQPHEFRDSFELSWLTTTAKASESHYMIYLEVLGLLAKKLREENEFFNDILKFTEQLEDLEMELRIAKEKERKILTELKDIEKEETAKAIIERGYVNLPKPKAIHLRDRDTYATRIDSVKVGKVTEKTITLEFYIDNKRWTTNRYKLDEGKDMLYNVQVMANRLLEEMLEESKK